ncbi:hypothetical protein E4U55_006094 [Claviceps digitariae]|nr:hypothetical protein E4U55_006094 [Claviceps digitariae]
MFSQLFSGYFLNELVITPDYLDGFESRDSSMVILRKNLLDDRRIANVNCITNLHCSFPKA